MTLERFKMLALASAIAVAAPTVAAAQQPLAPMAGPAVVSLPTAGVVGAVYDQFKLKPIWFATVLRP